MKKPNPDYSVPHQERPVLIATLCNDTVHADFAQSLLYMCLHASSAQLYYGVNFTRTSLIEVGRNAAVDEALKSHATHILFVDSDMVFPPHTLTRLLSHNKPIVGATYCGRRSPRKLNHVNLNGSTALEHDSGVHEVMSLPGGMILIDTDVFRYWTRPWFHVFWETPTKYVSEDVQFCFEARDRNIKVWLDVDLSKQIHHCGLAHYSVEHAQFVAQMDDK